MRTKFGLEGLRRREFSESLGGRIINGVRTCGLELPGSEYGPVAGCWEHGSEPAVSI